MNQTERVVFSYQWHITDECNLACTHCYRDENRQEPMPVELAKERVIDQILTAAPKMKAIPFLALSGGEPLLHPGLFDLLDYLRLKNEQGHELNVVLVTNGTLVDETMVKRLAAYQPMLSDIQISLDGATPEVHDAIRGRGTFARSVAALRRIIADTTLNTTVSFTFHRGNAGDIPGLLDLGEELGVSILYVTRLVPIGRGAELGELNMGTEEVRAVLEQLHERGERWMAERAAGQRRPIVSQDQTLFHLTDPELAVARCGSGVAGFGNACAVASATLTILADGTVLPCRRLPIPIGNLREQSMLEIWFGSDLLWQFRQRQRHVAGKCQECQFMTTYPQLCSGGAPCIAYGTCGDYNQPDPHCWYDPAVAETALQRSVQDPTGESTESTKERSER